MVVTGVEQMTRQIETPTGSVEITENLWDKGKETENWTVTQNLSVPSSAGDMNSGEVVAMLLERYAVALDLAADGYEAEKLTDSCILWKKYTNMSEE